MFFFFHGKMSNFKKTLNLLEKLIFNWSTWQVFWWRRAEGPIRLMPLDPFPNWHNEQVHLEECSIWWLIVLKRTVFWDSSGKFVNRCHSSSSDEICWVLLQVFLSLCTSEPVYPRTIEVNIPLSCRARVRERAKNSWNGEQTAMTQQPGQRLLYCYWWFRVAGWVLRVVFTLSGLIYLLLLSYGVTHYIVTTITVLKTSYGRCLCVHITPPGHISVTTVPRQRWAIFIVYQAFKTCSGSRLLRTCWTCLAHILK